MGESATGARCRSRVEVRLCEKRIAAASPCVMQDVSKVPNMAHFPGRCDDSRLLTDNCIFQ